MKTQHYPPAPAHAMPVKPSAAFKKEVVKVTVSIVLFFIVYLLLMLAAVALAAGCFAGGIAIMVGLGSLIGLVAGVGLMAVGVSVVFFLIKFIFSGTKNEDPSRIQIYEADQPELFAFIRQLAADTQTRFPKKIFISPAVNACVFYNSSFWSMFFPVRKNLEIGLGLVNSVNLSEFKAIMAHEFGHFSQQSMKLGSFTYNVNRIIYNMLYENTGYTKFLNGWGQVHWLLSLFAQITVGIAQGIQSILKGMYQLINKHYMGLSRQMEYNADAIAASVAGGNNLVSSLYRLDLCQSSYNTVLEKADVFLKENMVSSNLFSNHTTVVHTLAKHFELPVVHGLPQVSAEFIDSFSKSRVNYKDQWASHPTNKEREAELVALQMDVTPDTRSAWLLFEDAEGLQQVATRHIYRDIQGAATLQQYDAALFEQRFAAENDRYRLPAVYGKFYDNRIIDIKDWNPDETIQGAAVDASLDDILTDEHKHLPESIRSNERDLITLQQIRDKAIDVQSFDFDGEKYDRASAGDIIEKLEAEIKAQKEKLALLDKRIYRLLCHRALGEGFNNAINVRELFTQLKQASEITEDFFNLHTRIYENILPFYQGGISLDDVNSRVNILKSDLELKLKARLRDLLANPELSAQLPPALQERMTQFNYKEHYYFAANEFSNEDLEALTGICRDVSDALGEMRFQAYKHMLVKQAAVLA